MEFNARKYHLLEMENCLMWSSWTYKLEQNIIPIEKEEKDFGLVIQDNLSPEKHIDSILCD